GVRPFVPDGHAMLVEPFDVRVAAQKPEQLVNDGLGVNLLRGEQRKRFAQRTTDLRAENGKRARARAVGLELAMFVDVAQQIEVWNHRGENLTTNGVKQKKFTSGRFQFQFEIRLFSWRTHQRRSTKHFLRAILSAWHLNRNPPRRWTCSG